LFEGAPEFIKAMIAEDETMSSADPVAMDEKQKYFVEAVRPIFEQKCMSCHGEEKQKNGYRLDRKDVAFKGGDSEKVAIKPGQPLDSNLVRLILLPSDADDVMPPSGKSVLTPEEIGKILHWITTGAVFVEKAGVHSPAADPAGR
jgi:mono/diheme cytochrome c family protein